MHISLGVWNGTFSPSIFQPKITFFLLDTWRVEKTTPAVKKTESNKKNVERKESCTADVNLSLLNHSEKIWKFLGRKY